MKPKGYFQEQLIPGLKDTLALQCLARIPRSDYHSIRRVSRSWRMCLLSKELFRLRKLLGIEEPWIYVPFYTKRTSIAMRSWIEAYDPRNNAWRHVSSALPGVAESEILRGFAFISIEEKLFVIGGTISSKHDDSGHEDAEMYVRKEVYMLNCITNKWSQCASMSIPRVDFACTVSNGLIYVAGGRSQRAQTRGSSSAEVYVPDCNRWIPLPEMSIRRYKCVAVAWQEKIFIVGGFIEADGMGRSSVDVFDPATCQWDLVQGMWQLDVPPNQIVATNGQLYSSGDVLNTWKGRVEVYDAGLNLWKIVSGSQKLQMVMYHEQCYLTMAAIAKSLFFIGGYKIDNISNKDGEHKGIETVNVFHIATGQWSESEPVAINCQELCAHCCLLAL